MPDQARRGAAVRGNDPSEAARSWALAASGRKCATPPPEHTKTRTALTGFSHNLKVEATTNAKEIRQWIVTRQSPTMG